MRKQLFIITCLLFFSPHLLAIQVEPLIQTMEESGKKARSTFRVENTSDVILELEIEAFERSIQGRERELLKSADNDFMIMPPMAQIEPGEHQIFRIRYLGKQKLNQTQSYRIFFRQLPIQESSQEGNQVKFVFNLGALVFVDPVGATPEVSSYLEDNQIVLSNHGNAVADLSQFTLAIESPDDSITLSWQQIAQYGSASFLAPNQETLIPVSDWYKLKGPPVEVNISK
jgi:fimbrial chaperone protein